MEAGMTPSLHKSRHNKHCIDQPELQDGHASPDVVYVTHPGDELPSAPLHLWFPYFLSGYSSQNDIGMRQQHVGVMSALCANGIDTLTRSSKVPGKQQPQQQR
eukprot:GHUV01028976.1.p3 GENE.GHUV01028976.1~~GHUV01028976.1.p3  ORF type:complete len:103 (+),score=23.84 GHUV01028976.1:416-724(+)